MYKLGSGIIYLLFLACKTSAHMKGSDVKFPSAEEIAASFAKVTSTIPEVSIAPPKFSTSLSGEEKNGNFAASITSSAPAPSLPKLPPASSPSPALPASAQGPLSASSAPAIASSSPPPPMALTMADLKNISADITDSVQEILSVKGVFNADYDEFSGLQKEAVSEGKRLETENKTLKVQIAHVEAELAALEEINAQLDKTKQQTSKSKNDLNQLVKEEEFLQKNWEETSRDLMSRKTEFVTRKNDMVQENMKKRLKNRQEIGKIESSIQNLASENDESKRVFQKLQGEGHDRAVEMENKNSAGVRDNVELQKEVEGLQEELRRVHDKMQDILAMKRDVVVVERQITDEENAHLKYRKRCESDLSDLRGKIKDSEDAVLKSKEAYAECRKIDGENQILTQKLNDMARNARRFV